MYIVYNPISNFEIPQINFQRVRAVQRKHYFYDERYDVIAFILGWFTVISR